MVEKKAIRSSIAKVPSAGYVQRDNYSKAFIHWLEYQMELARRKGEPLNIKHALNGDEAEILVIGTKYKVDGWSDNNTVYKYHVAYPWFLIATDILRTNTVFTGCLWHGCPMCYTDRTIKNPKTGKTMDQMFALAKIKEKVFALNMRYNYVCNWEHEWLKLVREDPDVSDFVAGLDIQYRLDPQESSFGGRTIAAKLRYTIKYGEKVKYVDFTR